MKQMLLTATLAALMTTGLMSTTATASAKPDLKVSAIATPGGICNQNKVRVSIVNSQQVGVNEDIPVILFVSQPPNQPTSHIGVLQNGIGPNSNSGSPVWFHDIPVQAGGGQVNLRALVNPDLEIEESVYNNNTKIVTVNCASQSAPTLASLKYFKFSIRNKMNYPIKGAYVSVAGQKRKTNNKGTVIFKNLKPGKQHVTVYKKGCKQLETAIRVNLKSKSKTLKMGNRCA